MRKVPHRKLAPHLLAVNSRDELRLATKGQSKVYGISLKDRASHTGPQAQPGNAAFWIDQASGRFITSTFYMPQLPDWQPSSILADAFDQAAQEAKRSRNSTQSMIWSDAHPPANSYELDFAKALIQASSSDSPNNGPCDH